MLINIDSLNISKLSTFYNFAQLNDLCSICLLKFQTKTLHVGDTRTESYARFSSSPYVIKMSRYNFLNNECLLVFGFQGASANKIILNTSKQKCFNI